MTAPAAPTASGRAATLGAAVRLQAGILLALVFVAGLLSGLLAARAVGTRVEQAPAGADAVFLAEFAGTFDLDAQQRRTLRLILEAKAEEKRGWWNDHVLMQMEPKDRQPLLAIDRAADQRILQLLRPEQLALYKEMVAAGTPGR